MLILSFNSQQENDRMNTSKLQTIPLNQQLTLLLCVLQRLTIPSGCPASFAELLRSCWVTEPKVSDPLSFISTQVNNTCMFSFEKQMLVFWFRNGQCSSRSSPLWSPCQMTANSLNSATPSFTTRLNGGNEKSHSVGTLNVFVTHLSIYCLSLRKFATVFKEWCGNVADGGHEIQKKDLRSCI